MRFPALAAVVIFTAGTAQAQQTIQAVRPIEGYVCAKLNVTGQEALDTQGGVPIRTAPSSTAPTGTLAPSILFVKQPRHVVHRYVEVLQMTGKPGWIEQRRVTPFDPNARCIPSIMSNGRPGIG